MHCSTPALRAFVFSLSALLGAAALPAGAALPQLEERPERPSIAPMLERITPAVVNIATSGTIEVRQNPLMQDPFFRRFFNLPNQPRQRRSQSLGSGVIIDAEAGYIVTNHHVIKQADEILVTLTDGRELQAELVGSDPDTDLAVIQVEAEDLTAVKVGQSRNLRVGDFVVAIGNPFGLGQTVTSGIVSAVGRTGLGIEGYEDFIQTDASINPGNSGGALIDLNGELVGINTAILSPAGGNIGIGFAIPVHMMRQIAGQLIEHGEVHRGRLGVAIQDLSPALAEAFDLADGKGAVVAQVAPGSAAAEAGLQAGDVITAVDAQPVTSAAALRNRIGLRQAGDEVQLTVQRAAETLTVTATLEALDERSMAADSLSPRLSGAQFGEIQVELPNGKQALRVGVLDVARGSPAARAGLRPGDVILSVNRRQVENMEQFRNAVSGGHEQLLFHIRRGDAALFMILQ